MSGTDKLRHFVLNLINLEHVFFQLAHQKGIDITDRRHKDRTMPFTVLLSKRELLKKHQINFDDEFLDEITQTVLFRNRIVHPGVKKLDQKFDDKVKVLSLSKEFRDKSNRLPTIIFLIEKECKMSNPNKVSIEVAEEDFKYIYKQIKSLGGLNIALLAVDQMTQEYSEKLQEKQDLKNKLYASYKDYYTCGGNKTEAELMVEADKELEAEKEYSEQLVKDYDKNN